MASKKNGTLYVGVTNDLAKRVYEHKTAKFDGFTKQYDVKYLVYAQQTDDIISAISREKQIKHWNRAWKLNLIEKDNPQWQDLATDSGSPPARG